MSEFLLIFRGGQLAEGNASPEQMQAHMQKWIQWMEGLGKQGKLVGSQPLEPNGKKIQGKKKVVTDGPFMEGKEMVGGYLVCKAADLNEATEIAKGCPILEFDSGNVEVRPIHLMQM
jgi:hypothetical protein